MLQVFRNIKIGLFITFVNFLIQGVSFFVQNFVAKNLGGSQFGYFGILQSDYLIFCALADFGMMTLILAFFEKSATKGTLFRNTLQLRIFCSLAAAISMILFAFIVRQNHPVFRGELILAFGLFFQHAFFDWYFICGHFWKRLLASKLIHAVSYSIVMGFSLLYLQLDKIEHIAFAMVLAALPAWGFGLTQVPLRKLFYFSKKTLRFFRLMFKAAFPYALGSLASFAYLPVGLYIVDHFASPIFLSAYNFANKIIVLASGFMVHFISSSLISLHNSKNDNIQLKDTLLFTLFIAVASSPLWLFPEYVLQVLFFAAPWDDYLLTTSAFCLRFLSFSLIFQAIRMSMISTLLKEKKTWECVLYISSAGLLNVTICFIGARMWGAEKIPLLVLIGDGTLSVLLISSFAYKRRLRW